MKYYQIVHFINYVILLSYLIEKGAITDNCPIATPSIIASYLALFNILCIEKHLES